MLLEPSERVELALPFGGEEVSSSKAEREQLLGAAAGFYRAVVQLVAQQPRVGASS